MESRIELRIDSREKERWRRIAKKRNLSNVIRLAMGRLEKDIAAGRVMLVSCPGVEGKVTGGRFMYVKSKGFPAPIRIVEPVSGADLKNGKCLTCNKDDALYCGLDCAKRGR